MPDFVLVILNILTQKVRVTPEDYLRSIRIYFRVKAIEIGVRSIRDTDELSSVGVKKPDFVLGIRNALAQKVRVAMEDDLCAIGVDFRAGAMSTAPPPRRW